MLCYLSFTNNSGAGQILFLLDRPVVNQPGLTQTFEVDPSIYKIRIFDNDPIEPEEISKPWFNHGWPYQERAQLIHVSKNSKNL